MSKKEAARAGVRPALVWVLVALLGLISLNALVVGVLFMAAPDGHLIGMTPDVLQGSPFNSYVLPGILLFVFNGLYPAAVIYSLLARPAWRWPDTINPFKDTHWAWAGTLAAGVTLMVWIAVQVILLGYIHPIQPICFVIGLATVLIALTKVVRNFYILPKKAARVRKGKGMRRMQAGS